MASTSAASSATSTPQAGILQTLPATARYLGFALEKPAALRAALERLSALADGRAVVVGLGLEAVAALGAEVPGLRAFPDFSAAAVAVPATPMALWCWLRALPASGGERATDLGDLLQLALQIEKALQPALRLVQTVDGISHARPRHGPGRDLSGYEDGTENPARPRPVALVRGQGAGFDGASFVAVQQWRHQLQVLDAMPIDAKDAAIGRRQSDNAELDDAPASAHVKRTAQESFSPEAFVWRRSMPWVQGREGGLMFVAFGHSLDAFEAQMRRMAGLEDGIVDALFQFSAPLSGAYFWCPPMRAGRLDFSALGL